MESTNVIKGIRSKRLLSQSSVADKLGISRQTYNSLENDMMNNDFMLVFKILDVFELNDVETDEFFNALKQDYLSYKNLEQNENKK